jgi:hypothetical protein
MLYRVCDHYEDLIENNNKNVCFICFEIENENETHPILLNEQIMYAKDCACDASVHKSCLKLWFNVNKSCPICRIHMCEKYSQTFILLTIVQRGVTFVYYINYLGSYVVKFLVLFFFFYGIIEFFITVKNVQYLDDYNSPQEF